jgi:transcription termination factor NusB
MSRKIAREIAFKVVFSYDFQGDEIGVTDLIDDLKKENTDITLEDDAYIQNVVDGVIQNKAKLDEIIQKYLKIIEVLF